MKALLICYSYHHNNTLKVAEAMAKVLDAEVKRPKEVDPEKVPKYDLVGFGGGIYSARHHDDVLELADRLPKVKGGFAFIYSTSAIMGEKKVQGDHSALREKLEAKGYRILGDFACKGFNTNSFLKYFGGMNKGRPDAEDLRNAEEFARRMMKT